MPPWVGTSSQKPRVHSDLVSSRNAIFPKHPKKYVGFADRDCKRSYALDQPKNDHHRCSTKPHQTTKKIILLVLQAGRPASQPRGTTSTHLLLEALDESFLALSRPARVVAIPFAVQLQPLLRHHLPTRVLGRSPAGSAIDFGQGCASSGGDVMEVGVTKTAW